MKDRENIFIGLIGREIRNYFKKNPVPDSSVEIKKIYDKIEELSEFVKALSEKRNESAEIEIDTGISETLDRILAELKTLKK